jgi:ubiquinone/menaquinone biosynthesis C-methylase UbiE
MKVPARLFAALYERTGAAVEDAGLRDIRRAALAPARGRTLEIGAGTGLNVPLYPAAVEELVLTEPEGPMLRRLRERAPAGARVVQAGADRLPFADGSFDTVVSTLVLCTVPDQAAALAEIRRVLAPGGRLLFLEHVRAEDPRLARWQDRAVPIWRFFGRGCHPNRDTAAAIERAGFAVERLERGRVPRAPAIVRPLITGVAVRP